MKFTLKQLYGYSVMNWKQFLRGFLDGRDERECAFCKDSEACSDCRIDHDICDLRYEDNLYSKISDMEIELIEAIFKIIGELTKKYEES